MARTAEAQALVRRAPEAHPAKVAGKPPLQIIRVRTAIEARRLLIYSTMTISEIGYSLGFEDPAYFSRFFVAEEGISPRQFRSKWREGARSGTASLLAEA